jgi:CRP/FNR family cyclic AMP-dependent transcriptional regulator
MVVTTMPPNGDYVQAFACGQRIFSEGQHGDWMYVVVEGEVELLVNNVLVERLGPGGVLGEMSLIDAAPRSATAVARTHCKLWSINQKRFSYLVQQTPDFALQMMRVMAVRLRHMDQRVYAKTATARAA